MKYKTKKQNMESTKQMPENLLQYWFYKREKKIQINNKMKTAQAFINDIIIWNNLTVLNLQI